MNVLRKLVFIFLICLLVKIVFSQQQYYIYIQSENQEEFYVRTGSRIFNSSGNGYLVIPGLEKNTHEIIIGFPGKKEPEWRFNCTISEADLGFVLKAKDGEGVQLLNLKQKDGIKGTVVEHRPQIKESSDVVLTGAISNDPFSSMLADVVNDPTIRQQLVIVEKETAPAIVVNDDSAKTLHASVPLAQTGVNGDKNKNKEEDKSTPLQSVTESPAETKPTAAIAVEKETAPFVVKEIEKTNAAQTEKSSKAGAEEKSASAVIASAGKKYEPFVVKEIHEPANAKTEKSSGPGTEKKEDSVVTAPLKESERFVVKEIGKKDNSKTTSPEKTGIEKSTDNNEETKYLPFVIKPADEKNTNEDKTAKSETEKKADTAGLAAAEKNAGSLVIKKEDKSVTVEKEKSARSGSGKKDTDSSRVSLKEKQSPAEKKAVLSSVRKTLERKSRDGTDLIYVDENASGAKDTIRIFIPIVL